MDFYISHFFKALVLPPTNILFLLFIVVYFLKFNIKYARVLLIVSCGLFYTLSSPIVSTTLIGFLEDYPALTQQDLADHKAQAIVILGGGRESAAEYEQDTVSLMTLQRLRYGAYLQSKTGLPILVAGGFIDPKDKPEGLLMAESLERDFKIKARWQENKSRNTAENAILTREILQSENINTIFLVTKAWHLPRSVEIFKKQGFNVIPAPTGFDGFNPNNSRLSFYDFFPSGSAIQTSFFALHEMLGRLWYFVRY